MILSFNLALPACCLGRHHAAVPSAPSEAMEEDVRRTGRETTESKKE